MKELTQIQLALIANKNKNAMGRYNYRTCEGILQACKEHMAKAHCSITMSDEIYSVGDRIYIRATATITNEQGESVSCTGNAREAENRNGMDVAQVTGAASSYARKYALCGLLAIDDNADPDALFAMSGDTNDGKGTVVQQEEVETLNDLPDFVRVKDIAAVTISVENDKEYVDVPAHSPLRNIIIEFLKVTSREELNKVQRKYKTYTTAADIKTAGKYMGQKYPKAVKS